MRKRTNKLFTLITTIMMTAMVILSPLNAKAGSEFVDTDRDVSITINALYGEGRTPVSDMPFKAYKIADLNHDGSLTFVEHVAAYDVSVEEWNAASWTRYAQTVASFLERDSVEPNVTGRTDDNGRLVWSTAQDRLMQGIYIVIGDPVRNGTATYSTNMFLVSLPGLDPDGDIYIYDVEVSAKLSTTPDEPVSRRVVKVWDGEPTTGAVVRPTSIDVRLMRNGLAYETVTLNAANDWRYQWDELDPAARWTVTEVAVPANYRMTVTAEGVSFQMINTYVPPEVPPTIPPTTPPDNPPPTYTPPTTTTPPTETPTVQGVKRVPVETPETPEVAGASRLPQTGVLFWPIPVLLTVGALFIVQGILCMNEEKIKLDIGFFKG